VRALTNSFRPSRPWNIEGNHPPAAGRTVTEQLLNLPGVLEGRGTAVGGGGYGWSSTVSRTNRGTNIRAALAEAGVVTQVRNTSAMKGGWRPTARGILFGEHSELIFSSDFGRWNLLVTGLQSKN